MTWSWEWLADSIHLGTKHQRTHTSNTLKELRILRGRFKLASGHKTRSSTDWTFPLLKGWQGQHEKALQWFTMPDWTQKPGDWNRSIKCSWNKSYSQPASNPLLEFSFTPSYLCGHSPLSTLSLIFFPFDICPLKRCPVLVKPILPCLTHNIHLLFLPI